MNDFCRFIGKSPTQLIKKAQKDHDLGIEDQKIYNCVEDYLNELKDAGKSTNSIKNRYDTLRAFFKSFDIETPNIKDLSNPHKELSTGIPDKSDIKKAIRRKTDF